MDVAVKLESCASAASIGIFDGRVFGPAIDLIDRLPDDRTADHYAIQWGPSIGFQEFARRNPHAMKATPGRQLGWPNLFNAIRKRAAVEPVRVYDAACGFGGIMDELLREPAPAHLLYVGADIHRAIGSLALPPAARPDQIFLFRWDISKPLPVAELFDYVLCRASIHHTPNPRSTFSSLVEALAPGGTLVITAYAKKGRVREAVDDALRAEISRMCVDEAWGISHEFSLLGHDVQRTDATISISQDLPFLDIKAGTYKVHEFLYDHFMKNWYNGAFGLKQSDVVNFDWYHPPYAYRYSLDELTGWFADAGLFVTRTDSIKAQHYVEGRKPA
jgi:SAM-dependent methyltransferase